jgi:hypothetical protein
LLLFFHDIFENSLFALGHGTVCRSCLFIFRVFLQGIYLVHLTQTTNTNP